MTRTETEIKGKIDMNKQLEEYARKTLKDGLSKLTQANHRVFKMMYARDNGHRSVEDAEAMDINEVVDKIPIENLDWAMQQVQRTLNKNA